MADYYDQETPDESMNPDGEVDVPDEKLGLVTSGFFKNPVEPGDREMIEVVKVYDNEVAIKCVYGEDSEEESEDEEMAEAEPIEAEADEMMG